jgi:predicted nuclease of predicted toxin-antitoxin system
VIRILADENVPLASVRRLRRAGIDAEVVAQGSSDAEVLARAAAEQRVIVTFDRDLGRLALHPESPGPAGVVCLRAVPDRPEAAAEIVIGVLAQPGVELLGRFTVIRAGQVRQRALPTRRGGPR